MLMLVITLASLALAAAAVVFAWRVHQEAERRSEARVALLMAELATTPVARPDRLPEPQVLGATVAASPRRPSAPALRAPARPPLRQDSGLSLAASPRRQREREMATDAISTDLFAQQTASDTTRLVPPWAFAIGAALLVLVGLVAVSALTGPPRADQVTRAAAASSAAPLELLSLEHETLEETVLVRGLVRNPARAAARDELAVVIVLFDRRGDVLSNTPAPVEIPALAPGAESPFEVRVPQPAGASRLEVRFHENNGRAAPHVDRRTEEAP